MSDKSFQSLYLRQLPSLRRFIARFMVQTGDVDDVLQETFIKTAAKDITQISSPKAYLYKAARNIALNAITAIQVQGLPGHRTQSVVHRVLTGRGK